MPSAKFDVEDSNEYLTGLNSYHESEAIKDALLKAQSTPQRAAYGLYTERISGTSFTAKRAVNKQTWLYRILPSTAQDPWKKVEGHSLNIDMTKELMYLPDQFLWKPHKIEKHCTFLDGVRMIAGAGEPMLKNGVAYYSYSCGMDMDKNQAFYSAHGDWLIVPQMGVLDIETEMGPLRARPCEIVVIPRGIRFRVTLPKGPSRGFVLESFSGHFDVPELGQIGTLGLANVRDFEIPKAKYTDSADNMLVFAKFGGKMYTAISKGSAFNVVAWHGTYYPFRYDLGKFMPIGSTLYDHQDPSIFMVLTCPSDKPDHPAVDFLCLGPRWQVMENTFRLPYFHRNTMSEFSSVIKGGYDSARVPEAMFGMSGLHNCMSPHGLGVGEVEENMRRDLEPERIGDDMLAFVWESCYQIGITRWARDRAIATNATPAHGGFRSKFKANM